MLQGLIGGHVSGLYYAMSLPHSISYPPEHYDCPAPECESGQSKLIYKTKHRKECEDDGQCQSLGPELKTLESIVEDGKILLLVFSQGAQKGNAQVTIEPLMPHKKK